ncbi:protein of unknown function [Paraburkholderia kururiensis]
MSFACSLRRAPGHCLCVTGCGQYPAIDAAQSFDETDKSPLVRRLDDEPPITRRTPSRRS